MNPTNAASAAAVSNGFSGVTVAIIVVLALIVVAMAVALLKKGSPSTAVATIETAAKAASAKVVADAEAVAEKLKADVIAAAPTVTTDTVAATVESAATSELDKLLASVETKLTDTSGEDAAIAAAQQYLASVAEDVRQRIAAANEAKAVKSAALATHVATLQAKIAVPSLDAPVAGS